VHIVFHGENAASFSSDFASLLSNHAEIAILPDVLASDDDRQTYASAEVIVGIKFDRSLPRPQLLRLFHVPGAGYDAVDLAQMPPSAVVCNCFGHEQAIAEYVMAAILARHIPLHDADRRLRRGDWAYWAGARERVHQELAEKSIGILGFGHIGKAIAVRAKAFEMKVHVANRSPASASPLVDRFYSMSELPVFFASADFIVVSVPLTDQTKGMVGESAFASMRPSALLINVGRGPIVDEKAFYKALKVERIAGAIIDTWYVYPSQAQPNPLPSTLPFHELPNVAMTPHMSGWTNGTIRRRQKTIAENIQRIASGQPCVNVIRPAQS
jgi:phosphoglycerate dehydrogenase-like enzyme